MKTALLERDFEHVTYVLEHRKNSGYAGSKLYAKIIWQ
jgi:hypothetical protein